MEKKPNLSHVIMPKLLRLPRLSDKDANSVLGRLTQRIRASEACEIMGIHHTTLRKWGSQRVRLPESAIRLALVHLIILETRDIVEHEVARERNKERRLFPDAPTKWTEERIKKLEATRIGEKLIDYAEYF